jgi:hypothetical protein
MTIPTPRPVSLAAAWLLGAALAGCARTPQPEAVPPPPAAPANAEMPAPAAPANSQLPPPDAAPAAPEQPPPSAPPPQEPSPVPTPTSHQPTLDAMHRALPSTKMTLAVDLLYQLDDGAGAGQPATLHLAAVPAVEGQTLELSVKPTPGIELGPGALTVQKSGATNVYRRQYTVTRAAAAAAAVRVLVTMDAAAGSGFGYFTVPLEGGTSAQNRKDPAKQR